MREAFESRALRWFLLLYALVLMLAAPRISWWLDEVLTLSGAKEPSFAAMMVNLEKQQGAVPFAFLIPRWAGQLFGFTLLAARLSSILATVVACPAVYVLARRANLAYPLIAVLVFALWPLEFRYALEVRPYAVAVCLCSWLMVVYLDRWSTWTYVAMSVVLALTQPYALFLVVGHAAWSLIFDRSRLSVPVISLVVSAAVLTPWYLHFQEGWRAMSVRQGISDWNPRAVLVFLREISGSGYFGTAVLAVGLAFARRMTARWWIPVAIAILLVPVANFAFDYFFAVRQLIFVVPLLAVLFAAGAEALGTSGKCLITAFLIASMIANVNWFLRPREDWAAASDAIAAELERGACLRFVGDSEKLFVVFRPELHTQSCDGASRVVIAGSTYEPAAEQAAAATTLQGWTRVERHAFVAPYVEVYTK